VEIVVVFVVNTSTKQLEKSVQNSGKICC